MKSLLAIEWLKIKSFRTFWILVGFFIVLLPLWNYGISNGIMKFGGNNLNLISQAYSFPMVWQNLGFWTGVFVVFITILVIILTTNEYQFRTNRQNVIDGWSRLDFYHAKWHLVILLSLLTTAYVLLVGIGFGAAYGPFSEFPGSIRHLFFVWVLSLNYYAFGLLLSLFFKRSGITIGIFFLYSMIIESLLCKFINWSFKTDAGNFLPLQASDELLPFPVLEALRTLTQMEGGVGPWTYVAVSLIWVAAYYVTGRAKLLRSDW